MKRIIEEYGNTILLVILAAGCLWMYCNVWYGTGSFISGIYNQVFSQSTSDYTTVSTTVDGGCYIVRADGSHANENQQKTAQIIEDISKRLAPTMAARGTQNSTQALIGKWYNTTDLMYGLADNGSGNLTVLINASINNTNKDSTTNYFRVMSVTTGNGDFLISDTADVSSTGGKANGICYQSVSYADRKGQADDRSNYSSGVFHIWKPKTNTSYGNPEQWFDYDMINQRWYFYKSGTYCFRCFIVDSEGKSATGTVYIAVNRENTMN